MLKYILALMLLCTCTVQRAIVIPSDHEINPYPDHPGFYIISAGQLQELYDQQLLITQELEKCRAKQP